MNWVALLGGKTTGLSAQKGARIIKIGAAARRSRHQQFHAVRPTWTCEIPSGFYVAKRFTNANLTKGTGFSDDVFANLWEALLNMYNHELLTSGHLPPPINNHHCPECSLENICIPSVIAERKEPAKRRKGYLLSRERSDGNQAGSFSE